jgi:MFS family permease
MAGMFTHTFRSLRHRNYRLYFLGQIVSFTGSWMQSAALMWLVFDLTTDPLWPPILLVAAVGPTLVLGPIGGALADRFPKRKLVMATQSSFLVMALILIALVSLRVISPWLLFALQLVNGIVQAVDLPARLSFVPELIPKSDLINAVGLNSLTFNAARSVGPAMAGLMFLLADALMTAMPSLGSSAVMLGALGCFIFNATSYGAVLFALSRIDVADRSSRHGAPPGSFWDGFRFVRTHPAMGWLVILTGILSVFGWPVLTLLPAYTKFVLGYAEKSYSILVSALGAGALAGSLLTATIAKPAIQGRLIAGGAMMSLVGLCGLIVATNFALALLATMVFGFGLILYLSNGQSTMQLRSPDHARGKVMALWAMTLSGSSIPGHLIAGAAARTYPVTTVMAFMAIGVAIAAVAVIVLVTRPSFHASEPMNRVNM